MVLLTVPCIEKPASFSGAESLGRKAQRVLHSEGASKLGRAGSLEICVSVYIRIYIYIHIRKSICLYIHIHIYIYLSSMYRLQAEIMGVLVRVSMGGSS